MGNTPKTVSKTVPVTQCHLKQTVDCHEVVKKIPKKNCEAVETKVTVPVPVPTPPQWLLAMLPTPPQWLSDTLPPDTSGKKPSGHSITTRHCHNSSKNLTETQRISR